MQEQQNTPHLAAILVGHTEFTEDLIFCYKK